MILYSSNSIKNADGASAHLKVTGVEQDELKVYDTSNEILLKKIVGQLSIMNTHLSLLTDSEISNADLESKEPKIEVKLTETQVKPRKISKIFE
jgi:hypothetical protein